MRPRSRWRHNTDSRSGYPSTAKNIWGDVVHAFDEMVCSKDPSLRVLSVNPCEHVRGPDAGDDREGQILYSDELLALLRGIPVDREAEPVPLYRRQTYAMAIYTKARASELEAMTTSDVDLAHKTINITKQADRKSKGRAGTKRPKSRKVRTIDIEPNLLPLVKWLVEHPQGKGGRLLRMPPPEDRAELLRRDLVVVGITRKALHESDELERMLVFHDLRDTGLTHMAVRADAPLLIQWNGGHADLNTTQGYIDRGRVERQRIGEPLPPLPPELWSETAGDLAEVSDWVSDESETDAGTSSIPLAFLRPQRELNSKKRYSVTWRCRSSFVARVRESHGVLNRAGVRVSPARSSRIDRVHGEILETDRSADITEAAGRSRGRSSPRRCCTPRRAADLR